MYEHITKINNLPEDKRNWWFIIPRMIIDKTKYRGKGRPRKSDYRVYPNDTDLVAVDWNKIQVEDAKTWVMSRGDGV